MKLRFWRRRDEVPQPVRKPRESPPADTGGRDARLRAEEALREAQERRKQQQPIKDWFLADAQANHYGEHIAGIWGGRR